MRGREREIVPILMMMRMMIRDCTNIDDDEDDDRIDIGQEKCTKCTNIGDDEDDDKEMMLSLRLLR